MKRTRRVPAVSLPALAFLTLLCAAPPVRALEVGLEVRACTDVSEARVRELTELELTTQVVSPRASGRLAALVSVACTGNDVLIRVTDATTGKLVSRTFTLTEVEPDVRARAIALAASELVLTSWMELVLAKPPESARSPTWVKEEDRRAASAVVRSRSEHGAHVDAVLALAELGGTFHAAMGSWGGGLRLSMVSAEPHLAIDADLSSTIANEHTLLGEVRTNTWSVALRPALRFEQNRWIGSVGVGARIGLARVSGHAADASASRGHVVAGTWAGPLAHANLGFGFAHFAARLGAEAGFALRGVSGSVDGREQAGVRGAWLLVSVGLGWGA